MDNSNTDSDELTQDELHRLEVIVNRVKSGEETVYRIDEVLAILNLDLNMEDNDDNP